MPHEQRDNSGTLFRNEDRATDNHPNAKGKAMIGGVLYYVSAWTKTATKTGQKYQSLAFTPAQEHAQPHLDQAKQALDEPDDEIPF